MRALLCLLLMTLATPAICVGAAVAICKVGYDIGFDLVCELFRAEDSEDLTAEDWHD